MRIAYAGDWHANTDWAIRAIGYAHERTAEVIVHLGDFGYDFRPGFMDQVEEALTEAEIELWFVDGNHEDFTWLNKQPVGEDGRRKLRDHIYHLPRGYRWVWNETTFLAMGGAFSVDRRWRKLNKSWWLEEVITDEEVENAIAGGPVDILIAHDCPTGVKIPGLNEGPSMFPYEAILRSEEHRGVLRKVVEGVKPREIWHGHYHRRYDALGQFEYGHANVYGLDMDATNLADNMVMYDLPDR